MNSPLGAQGINVRFATFLGPKTRSSRVGEGGAIQFSKMLLGIKMELERTSMIEGVSKLKGAHGTTVVSIVLFKDSLKTEQTHDTQDSRYKRH